MPSHPKEDKRILELKSAALHETEAARDDLRLSYIAYFRLKASLEAEFGREMKVMSLKDKIDHSSMDDDKRIEAREIIRHAAHAYLNLYNALARSLSNHGLTTAPLRHNNDRDTPQPTDNGTEIVESMMASFIRAAHNAAQPRRLSPNRARS